MVDKGKHFFLTSQSGRGFVNYYESELKNLNYVYVLKGVPGNGKSTLLRSIASYFENEGYPADMIHCAFDPDSLDGIILKTLGIGIVDGTTPHVVEPEIPYVLSDYINIGQACDKKILQKNSEEIMKLQKSRDESRQQFANSISQALELHDELEQFFIGGLNIDKANQLAADMIQSIFGENQLNKEANVKHRLFDAITDKGNVDFVQDITKECNTRYFIKGRPGSGKSTLMKQLVEASKNRGYDVELYHCDFDPDSLDMVVIPGLQVALFDSSEPHIYSPSRKGDEIVDTYTLTIETDTDEKYEEQIKKATAAFESEWETATSYMKQAKDAHRALEEKYSQAVDFDQVKEIEKYLIKEMSSFLPMYS